VLGAVTSRPRHSKPLLKPFKLLPCPLKNQMSNAFMLANKLMYSYISSLMMKHSGIFKHFSQRFQFFF